MNEDIKSLENKLDKAISGLEYWKSQQDSLKPFKDQRIEWGVVSHSGMIKSFSHRLSCRIDELISSQKLYAMLSTNNDLANKVAEYEIVLEFFQHTLQEDRKLLQTAQEKPLPVDILEYLRSRVEKLEKNVDRYQSWLGIFKSQLNQNEH